MKSPACLIVGCPRSGTTLLSVLLDRHSHLAITPETDFYGTLAPQLISCSQEELRHLLGEWHRLPELGLDAEMVLKHCGCSPSRRTLFQSLLELYGREKSKPFVGEKTPQHLNHLPAMLDDFPGSPVIGLFRDGREVALSLRSMPWAPGDLSACARLWIDSMQLCLRYQRIYPDQFRMVQYEELIAHPDKTLRAVMAWIGLPFERSQLSPDMGSGVVLSRSLAWKGNALAEINPVRVGSRLKNARADEVRFLNENMAPELGHWGYSI